MQVVWCCWDWLGVGCGHPNCAEQITCRACCALDAARACLQPSSSCLTVCGRSSCILFGVDPAGGSDNDGRTRTRCWPAQEQLQPLMMLPSSLRSAEAHSIRAATDKQCDRLFARSRNRTTAIQCTPTRTISLPFRSVRPCIRSSSTAVHLISSASLCALLAASKALNCLLHTFCTCVVPGACCQRASTKLLLLLLSYVRPACFSS